MERAIFLDRDGTINVEKDYLFKIEEFEFLPRVVEGLRILQDTGYKLIVITNQSGIARGFYQEEDCIKLNKWMTETLALQGISISRIYYCPHHPDAKILKYKVDCSCRKPKLGLFEQAIAEYDLDINQCHAIGDKIRDCAICKETGCRGFLIDENEKKEIIDNVKAGKYRNVFYAKTLFDAAKQIISRG